MTEIEEEQIQNQADVIKEEIQTLLDTSMTIEGKVVQTAAETRSWGKSLDEWHKDLTVPLDPSADPGKIKMYCSRLGNNLDIAYRNLSKTKTVAFNYGLSYNRALNEKITEQALNRGRKVAPAIETMTRVAEHKLPERVLVHQKLAMDMDFWEQMIWKIKDQIGIVKTMGMSNGTMSNVGEF